MASVKGSGSLERRGKSFLMRVNVTYAPEEAQILGKASSRISKKAEGVTTKRDAEKALRNFVEAVRFAVRTCNDLERLDERISEVESLQAIKPDGLSLASWAETVRLEEERKARSQTLAQFSEAWLDYRRQSGGLARSTIAREEQVIRRLNKYLGEVALEEMSSTVIKQAYSSMRADGVTDDGILRAHKKLKQVLNAAVAESLEDESRPTLYNPICKELVPTPKVERKYKRNSLDLTSVVYLAGILDEAGDADARIMGVRIGLATGLRIGEVMGLEWGCINLLEGTLTVKQQFTRYREISKTKTEKSVRTISLDPETVSHLLRYKEAQAEHLRELGLTQHDLTPVISNERGGYLDPCNYRRWFRDFCVRHGFGVMTYEDGEPVKLTVYNDDGTRVDGNGKDASGKPYSRMNKKPKRRKHYEGLVFHELRHTFASQMLSAGVDIVTVQKHLGHSKASTTLDMYSHALPGNDRKAVNLWGMMMAGKSTEEATV